jgi:thiosulfate/3-mercaptopyruvate sulfurtransferase
MGALGVGDGDTVVGYDDDGGAIAARLVWMLRATGHAATLLDGGIGAWHGPLSTEPGTQAPTSLTATPWPAERLADIDETAATSAVVIDARAAERFAGTPDEYDPRWGHIPGGGVTACHNLLVMEHAGLGPGRLFPGSWSQWSRDPARPVESGRDHPAR